MNGNVVFKTITVRGTSEGLDKVTADLQKLAAAHKDVSIAAEDSSKRTLSLEAAWKRQTMKLDETARSQANIARETRLADAALREGLATQAQHAQRLDQINQRYAVATVQAGNFTKQASRQGAEMLNLSRQFADVGVSLQAGQSPFTVLVQQGAQIVDVFAASNRTVGSFFSQAVSWAGRFAASTAGIITGIGGIAAAFLYMGSSFSAAQREIDKTLSATGGASGMTRGGINQIAGEAAGGGMSVSQARETATAFAATGRIYSDNIAEATKLTRDFAQAMGVDAADATKMFAAALVDPKNGALELNKQINFLDATTLNYIRSLQSQGDLQGAQKVMMDAMNKSVQNQLQYVGLLTKAWDASRNAASNFFDDVGKGAARVVEITTGVQTGGFTDEDRLRFAKQNQQTAQARLAGETDPGASKVLIQALTQAVKEANDEVDRLEKKLADVGASKKLAQLSLDADAFTRSIIPSIAQIEDLTEKVNRLKEAQAKGVGGPNTGAAITIGQAQLSIAQETLAVEERKAAVYLQQGGAMGQTLIQLRDQLSVAGAIGQSAQINAQYYATINSLLQQGKSMSDAIVIAEAQRAIALAQIEAKHQETMIALQGQLNVAQQITGLAQIDAQHEANINNLKLQGLSTSQAIAQADAQRAIALAQVETAAQQQLVSLQRQHNVISETTQQGKNQAQAQNTYNELVDKGVESTTAQAVSQQELLNTETQRYQQEGQAIEQREQAYLAANEAADQQAASAQAAAVAAENQAVAMWEVAKAAERVAEYQMKFIPFGMGSGPGAGEMTYQIGKDIFQTSSGQYSQFNPAGYTSKTTAATQMTAIVRQIYGEGGFDPVTGAPNAQGLEFQFNQALTRSGGNLAATVGNLLSGGVLSTGTLGAPPQVDQNKLGILSRAIDLLPQEQQIGSIQNLVGQLGAAPQSLQTAELIKQLNDKLEQLTNATDANTSATSAMTDVLSPFYSSDPRRTHLGFRAFAGGGIMTQYGELPLRQYQGGGMATSPQVAVFGEGSTPEAYVPVPSGRIPVEIKTPANSNQRPVNVYINVGGNADASTVAALKATAFQQAQAMRRVMG